MTALYEDRRLDYAPEIVAHLPGAVRLLRPLCLAQRDTGPPDMEAADRIAEHMARSMGWQVYGWQRCRLSSGHVVVTYYLALDVPEDDPRRETLERAAVAAVQADDGEMYRRVVRGK